MAQSSYAERRRYPRVAGRLRIRVARDRQQVATETVNVSCGGALCGLAESLLLMTRVRVALALPRRLVQCTGVVVRCAPVRRSAARGRYHVALFFTKMSRADHRAIAEFVLTSMFRHAPQEYRKFLKCN